MQNKRIGRELSVVLTAVVLVGMGVVVAPGLTLKSEMVNVHRHGFTFSHRSHAKSMENQLHQRAQIIELKVVGFFFEIEIAQTV